MSWHYSQEPGAVFSLPTYLAGLRSERSRLSSTPAKSCCSDNATGCSIPSLSGTMYAPSTASRGGEQLTLCRGDFPVKTSAWQEPVEDLPGAVLDCGLNICESLTRYGLAMSLPKTHRTCVAMDSAPSSKDLPAWGMVFDGVCWELGTSAHLISETECGYWPTPTAIQRPNEGNMRLVRAQAVAGEISWEDAEAIVGKDVRESHGKLKMFPTPTVQDAKNNGGPSQMNRNTKPLNAVVGGKLNPRWVEWLMGMPIGWASLQPLEMPKFQQWRRQHSEYYQGASDDQNI